jgi:hypothetical protein
MVFAYLPPEVRNQPQLFFSNVRVYQVTPRLKGQFVTNTTHYLFLDCFQSLRTKKNALLFIFLTVVTKI